MNRDESGWTPGEFGGDSSPQLALVPFRSSELSRSILVRAAQTVDLGVGSGYGPAAVTVQRVLRDGFSADAAYLTNSATSALEILAIALKERGYRRAIIPSFTHVSSASAFALHGYQIDFADIGDSLNLDLDCVAALEPDSRTVVLAVHYAGQQVDLDGLATICTPAGARVVEDLAHSFACRFRQPRPKASGSAGVLSFQLQKEVTCGDGGALVLFDPELEVLVRRIRDRGTNRREFESGEVDYYSWVAPGSSFAPSEITAAVLEAHLDRCAAPLQRRRDVLRRYVHELADWAESVGAALPVAAAANGAANTAYVLVQSEAHRRSLAGHLHQRGVGSAIHFPPLHRSTMARKLGIAASCPTADRVFAGLLRLPLYSSLTDTQVDVVVAGVRSWVPPCSGRLSPGSPR